MPDDDELNRTRKKLDEKKTTLCPQRSSGCQHRVIRMQHPFRTKIQLDIFARPPAANVVDAVITFR